MISNLNEINRVLLVVKNLEIKNNGAKEKSVTELLNRYCLDAQNSDSVANIQGCISFGLIRRKKDRLFHSVHGAKLFDLRTIDDGKTLLNLNAEQRQYLLSVLIESEYRVELEGILGKFRVDHNQNIWFYDSKIPNKSWNQDLVNVLFQLGFLTFTSSRIEIDIHENIVVSRIRHRITKSEQQLLEMLSARRETGRAAEALTLQFEKQRLITAGYEHLALAVTRISDQDVFAGYDVISFNGKKSGLEHDRYIEVKGTSGKNPVFYWSRNEIEMAKKYGNQYWIYLWTEVRSESQGKLERVIQNPYKVFFESGGQPPEPLLFGIDLNNY